MSNDKPCSRQPGHLIAADVTADPTGGFRQLAGTVDTVIVLSSGLYLRLVGFLPMTIAWAYRHPRFQGQKPPGFPGAIQLGTEVTVSRSRRSSTCHPSQVTLSMVLGGISTVSACAGAAPLYLAIASVGPMPSTQARTGATHIVTGL